MKRLVALALVAALLLLGAPPAAQAVNQQSQPFSFAGPTGFAQVQLNGQSSCAVVVSTLTGAANIAVTASSDGINYVVASQIGTGTISSTGTYLGNIAANGLLYMRVQQTNTGTAAGAITCSNAIINSSTSASVTFPYTLVTQGQSATAASGLGILGVYNSSPPTLTTGQASPVQLDVSGSTRVNCVTGCAALSFPYSLTVSGQTATTGSGVGILGVYNTSAPTLTNTQAAPFQLDVNGYVGVHCYTGCFAPLTGGASGVTTGANQSVGLAGYNNTTMDALKDTIVANALNVGIAGGSIANTGFNVTGTLPAYASTPAFSISGTLPAYAATPTFNCGTGCSGSFPYSGTSNGQTATTASFLGSGGLYNSSPPTLTNTQFAPLQVDVNGYLKTDCITGCGALTFPYSGTTNGQTATSASFLGAGGLYNSSPPTLTNGQYSPIQLNSSGAINVNVTNPPATQLAVNEVATTGGGATRLSTVTLTTNAVTSICASACTAFDFSAINTTGSACYAQEFNTASGSVTLGTTAPVRILLIPATAEAADNISPTLGIAFATAWSFAVTTTPTGSTACGSTVYAQADYK